MSTVIRDKKPNFWQWLRIQIGNLLPIDGHWLLGLPALVIRRGVLQELNLLPAPDAPPPFPANPVPDHRTADATGMDPKDNYAGASSTPFSRNMAPLSDRNPLRDPPVQLVAQKLLQRQKFIPAGMQLNVLAAAWIQFMSHDWMRGAQTEKEVELAQGTPQCPLKAFRFKKTDISKAGTVKNERTHWWDTSVLYGQDADSQKKIRLGKDGLLIEGPCRGVLPVAEDGGVLAGDNQNSWAGVQLLQELFLREHNAVAKCIAEQHPELRGNDEELFNKARLVVAAIAAKIHTVDWTVELLKTDTLYKGMNANWFGLPRAIGLSKKGPPALFSLVGKEADNHGVPFSLTEEFVAVYRLHPLIPDGLPLESGDVPISMLLGEAGEERLRRPNAPIELWDAIMKYPCGNLSLFNYPAALRSLTPTDINGKSESEKVDLAALDLYRDRERGIRNYNDFRRALHMKPFKNYHELTGGDEKAINALEEVYGADGIENLDFLVGNLAEKKIKGFAISETSFIIFLLMASRRLESDRFLNENFNEDTYTKAGFAWVKSVEGLGDVLRRHFPEMTKHFEGGKSAFTPNTAWPEHYLQPQTH